MRGAILAVAALLIAMAVAPPSTGAATAEGLASGWNVALSIDSRSAGAAKMFEAFDTASLNLYDFDGDGQLEIVSNNDNNRAYVIDSRTGRVLAEIATTHPSGERWPVRDLNPIAIGDLYGDGVPCMVIPSSAAYMAAWCYDAAASTEARFNFTKKWEVFLDASKYEDDFEETHPWLYNESGKMVYPGADGHAYLADVDGDGKMEIFVETDGYPGQFAFNHDGSYRWSRSFADGNAGAAVRDIDDDGVKEAVFASDAGLVVSYNADTGGIEWVFEAAKNGADPGSIPVPPLVADLHGDGTYETVFGARNVSRDMSDPDWVNESHARYFALDSKGRVLWSVSYDWMNPLQYNHPAPADVNEDGVLDVIFFDWNTVGHKPGDWNVTNRKSNLFALDGRDGSPIWHTPVTNYWSNKDFVIADVDGDGAEEIVVPEPRAGEEGLGVYSLSKGERVGWFPLDWSMSRGPVAGDLYGDGKLYLVVPVMKKITDRPNYRNVDVGYREGQLRIVETGAAYDVAFSANFLHNEDQEEIEAEGSSGVQPTPQTTEPPTPPTAITPAPPTDGGEPGGPDGGSPQAPGATPPEGEGPGGPRVVPAPGAAAAVLACVAAVSLATRARRRR